ncbi:MAG: cysteine desulfurase [Melioribacteraceae bacterium]|nr:cysteine desulfurase [Melioribacteraceae bacterium]MCF8263637.1 cysteine desulfurase [Melioribacteraceae bacterium]MCF8431891.1 cysteine desulfurase [Melioribacteraceae bacterium]
MKVYLDNAATTKIDPRVLEKMLPYLSDSFGNPSSIHSFGREVKVALEEARDVIADSINADPSEIYFVGSGTEANNFPIFGIAKTEFQESGRAKILTGKAEHRCVLDSFEELGKNGFERVAIPVDNQTELDYDQLEAALDDNVSLVSIIHTNNETGATNAIERIAKLKAKFNFYLHVDAVQSFGKQKIDVMELGVDALSISGHKIHGPKGIGVAFIKNRTPMRPMIFGGSQERNRRGGTENVAGIIGMAEATKISLSEMDSNLGLITKLNDTFRNGVAEIPDNFISINSPENASPYIISLTFNSDIYKNDAEAMLMYLDINGVAASNGAACTSGTLKPSHVILSSGKSIGDANGTIRFSFSKYNSEVEIEYALGIIRKMSEKFKK